MPTVSPPSASERQIAANRANAQKSTGPRTPEGRARAAMNALKEGVFARTPILPGEAVEEHQAMVAELVDDLAPADAAERELVDRVATLTWRRRRLLLAEEGLLRRELNRCEPTPFRRDRKRSDEENDADEFESNRRDTCRMLAKSFVGVGEAAALLKFADQERRLNGSIDAALRMLIKLQDRRAKREADGGAPNEPISDEASPPTAAVAVEPIAELAIPDDAAGESAPAPNEPISGEPDLLTAARRAERSRGVSQVPVAQNANTAAEQNEPILDREGEASPRTPNDDRRPAAPIEPKSAKGGKDTDGTTSIVADVVTRGQADASVDSHRAGDAERPWCRPDTEPPTANRDPADIPV